MGTTAGGFTYPESFAPIRDGYLNIQTLAQQVETRYGTKKLAFRAAIYTANSGGDFPVTWTPDIPTNCEGGIVFSGNNTVLMRIVSLNNGAGGVVVRCYHNDGTVFPAASMGAHLFLWGI